MGPPGPPGPPGLEEPESKSSGVLLGQFYSSKLEQDLTQIDVSSTHSRSHTQTQTHGHTHTLTHTHMEERDISHTPLQVPSDFDSEVVGAAMIGELEKMLSPLGTRENPAVSCLDIALCHEDHFTPGEPRNTVCVPTLLAVRWCVCLLHCGVFVCLFV